MAALGLPAQSSDGRAAFLATLTPSGRENNAAVLQRSETGLVAIARTGEQSLPDDTAAFHAFHALVSDSAGRMAFSATLRGGSASASPGQHAVSRRKGN